MYLVINESQIKRKNSCYEIVGFDCVIDKKTKATIERDKQIYWARIMRGESEKSARSGLSQEFIDWLLEEEIRNGMVLPTPRIPEREIIENGKAVWICEYCFPRGNIGVQEVTQCDYCKKWFCEKHLKPFISKEEDDGHPCPDYDK